MKPGVISGKYYHLANSVKNFDAMDFSPLSLSISFHASLIDLSVSISSCFSCLFCFFKIIHSFLLLQVHSNLLCQSFLMAALWFSRRFVYRMLAAQHCI